MKLPSSKERWITSTENVPALREPRTAAAMLAVACAAYIGLLVCAAVHTWIGLVISAIAVAVAEFTLSARAEVVVWALRRVQFPPLARALFAGAALVMFTARSTPSMTVWTVVTLGVIAGAGALAVGAGQVLDHLDTPPVVTRGLPVALAGVRRGRPTVLRRPGEATAATVLVIAIGLAAGAETHNRGMAALGLVLATAGALSIPTYLLGQVRLLRRARPALQVSDAIAAALAELAPQAALYFGSDAAWRYQVEMWLPVMETVGIPSVVIVRDLETFRLLAPTSLPVICAPRATALMQLPLPELRVALYVGNTATNVHFLRRPGVRSVFLGHGDSDKSASANPITRVYSEIWVAGQAGRDRYQRAGLEVPDAAFVQIGRPQLRDLTRAPDDVPMLTVLYAPTWEGWGENPSDSSLGRVGPALVRALLARPGIRVMYRPHPRSGQRDPDLRRAHAEVVSMLRAAGAREHATNRPPSALDRPRTDPLADMLAPDTWAARAAADAELEQWNATYWREHPNHRILTEPAPDLLSCFTRSDVLIGDISSVITDFLAADRPYAIVDPGYHSAPLLQESAPSTAGGFVLNQTLDALDELLIAGAGGPDPTAAARKVTAGYLLGPRPPDPAQPFRTAVGRLCRATRCPADLPVPGFDEQVDAVADQQDGEQP